MKLGSLFDGSGGFPLAGSLCGIEPVWAAEVEPYPIAVTRSRFPHMKHLGDVTKVSGADIEPVDIITFGSPCQDLSVAGKRAGLKHEAKCRTNSTDCSGRFMVTAISFRLRKDTRQSSRGNISEEAAMQKEDRITYERDRTITQLFHGQRYAPKMCDFADVDAAEIAVYNRLGEYEDTGLSPEEIEELKYKHDRLQDFEVANNEKLRKQIASLECQLQEALASAGNSKCKIHITVEGMCECETRRKEGENKRRIPWEAD